MGSNMRIIMSLQPLKTKPLKNGTEDFFYRSQCSTKFKVNICKDGKEWTTNCYCLMSQTIAIEPQKVCK